MNADGRTTYNHLADHIRFSHHFAAEEVSVKSHGSLQVNGPDDMLYTLDLHCIRPNF
jgi:hypothetical protein